MRSKISALFMACAFLAGTVIVPGTAMAWEKGNIKIVPGFKAEEKWDSNIFYDPSDEKDDFVTVLTPSILAEVGFGPAGKHKAKVDYKVDCGIFAEYDKQNYGNHNVLGEVMLDFNKYTLTVSDNFLFTSSRAGTEFESRNLRKENTGKAVIGMDFNKFDMDIGYSHYLVDYHSDLLEDLNRYENSVWTTAYFQVMPKTKGLIEYMYRNIQYNEASGRNANVNAVMVGLEGDITAKITGIIKAGYKYKAYTSSDRDDFSGAIVHTGLSYDPTDRVNILFAYEREPFESTYANNNFYSGDHFNLDASYRFGELYGGYFLAKASGRYWLNRYPEQAPGDTEKRTDHLWGVGGGLDYVWKEWLTVGAGYRFNQRESNIGSRDYDQHIINCDVRLVF